MQYTSSSTSCDRLTPYLQIQYWFSFPYMKNYWFRLVASVFISVLILWFLFNLINDEENPIGLQDVTRVLGEVSLATFLLFFIIHLLGVIFRTVRFQLLIRATQSEVVPTFWPLALVTLVRNMTVDLLPARLGELFYVGLLNRGLGVRLDSCFSSLAISIWFDVMVIIPLVLGMLLYPVLDVGIQQRLLLVVAILVFVCGVGILILYPGLSIVARWLNRFDSSSKILIKIQTFVSQFSDSVKLSLNWETIFKTFFLTVGVRVCKYSSIILLFMGIADAGYPDLSGADPGSILIGLLASEAAASLPIPTFMSFGTYEAGGLAAFAMLGMPVATAGLALFTVHLITQAVDYTLGGLAFVLFVMVTRTSPSTLAGLRHKTPN